MGSYDNGTAAGKGRSEYIWLPTEDGQAIPIGLHKNGQLYAIHSDHLGTPRLITDANNKPVWQWPYSAFGNNKPSGVLATTTENGQTSLKGTKPRVDFPLRDPGQYEDEETGMRHNMHRTYAQKLGRFPQPDPIGMAGGLNRFVYGENSPFMHTDPMGLQSRGRAVPTGPIPGMQPRPVDPSEPYGPTTTPGIPLPDLKLPPLMSGPIDLMRKMVDAMCKVDEKDKEICDKNLIADQDKCDDDYGNPPAAGLSC